MTTEQVLRYHAEKYPLMRPTDAVKLLFQNEFGGGHMIEDKEKSLLWLTNEYKAIMQDSELLQRTYSGAVKAMVQEAELSSVSIPETGKEIHQIERLSLTVPVGDGIVRVNLAAIDQSKLSLERFNEIFVESANRIYGKLESFLEKLASLKKLTQEGIFSFTSEILDEYLYEYEKQGYPAVSHSREYREAYHPAYRIVLDSLL